MDELITAGWRHHGVRVIGFGFVLGLIAALLPVAGAAAATDRPAVGVVAAAGDDGVQASRADSGEPSGESLIAGAGREGSDGGRASADESSGDQANGPAAAEPSDDAARAAHAGGSRPSQASFARDRGSERAIDAGSESSPANVSGAVAATDRPAVGVVTAAGDDGVQASRASGEPSGESLIARAGREGSDGDRASADESSGDQANGPAAAEPSDDAARAAHAGGSRPSQASFARDRGSERAIDAGSESSPANVSGEPSGDHLAGEFSIATAERERSGDDLEDSGESWRDERDGPAAAAGRAPDAGSEIFSTRAVAVDGAAQESAYAKSRRAAVSEGDSDWSESPSGAEGGVDESSSETAGEASGVAPSAPAEPLSSAVRPSRRRRRRRRRRSIGAQRHRGRAKSARGRLRPPRDRPRSRSQGREPRRLWASDRAAAIRSCQLRAPVLRSTRARSCRLRAPVPCSASRVAAAPRWTGRRGRSLRQGRCPGPGPQRRRARFFDARRRRRPIAEPAPHASSALDPLHVTHRTSWLAAAASCKRGWTLRVSPLDPDKRSKGQIR